MDTDLCTLEFKAKDDASDSTTKISAKAVVKCNSAEHYSAVYDSTVRVFSYLTGDVDGDRDADLDDAVYLFGSTMLPEFYPMSYYGATDFNGDGSVDTLDAIIVQKYAAEKTTLNERQLYVGDVNDDGYIDVLDAAMIQKYAVEKLSGFKKK